MKTESMLIDFMGTDLRKTTPIQLNQKQMNCIMVLGVIIVLLVCCVLARRLRNQDLIHWSNEEILTDNYQKNFINTFARINAEIILNEFKRRKQIL